MSKTLPSSPLVYRAFVTAPFGAQHKQKHNKPFISAGAKLLWETLVDELEKEGIKLPLGLASGALSEENLALVFDTLNVKYRFPVKDFIPKHVSRNAESHARMKAGVIKALAYALIHTKPVSATLYLDILNEVKKVIPDLMKSSLYLMGLHIDDNGGGSLYDHVSVVQAGNRDRNMLCIMELSYGGVSVTGEGKVKVEALKEACSKWFTASSR